MTEILVAIITGGLALVGVIYTNMQSNKRIEQQLQTAQAVTDVKIDNLREEVKKHNDFGSRIPILEEKINQVEGRMHQVEEDLRDLKNV